MVVLERRVGRLDLFVFGITAKSEVVMTGFFGCFYAGFRWYLWDTEG